eukprot:9492465-Pyramimonas_sp.AAC.1
MSRGASGASIRGAKACSVRSSSGVSEFPTSNGLRSNCMYRQAVSQSLFIVGMVKPSKSGARSSGAKRCLRVACSA